MKNASQPGTHLDAEQLAAFSENVLPAQERELCLAHLASCARCREIVFLSSDPEAPPAAASQPKPARSWITGLNVWALAGTALACSLVMAIAIHKRRSQETAAPPQIAVNAPPHEPAITQQQPAPQNASVESSESAPHRTPARPADQAPKSVRPAAPAAGKQNLFGLAGGTGSMSQGAGAGYAANQENLASEAPQSKASPSVVLGGLPAAAAPQVSNKSMYRMQSPSPESAATGAASSALPLSAEARAIPPKDESAITLRTLANPSSRSVAGKVTDSTGAAVPGAVVSLQQVEGPLQRQTIAGKDGSFAIAALPPGKYRLETSAPGFQHQVQQLDVGAQQVAQIESRLAPGMNTETVDVSSAAVAMSTDEISALPDHLAARVTRTIGKHMLALDENGALFLSTNRGRKWSAVKPAWPDKIASIEAISAGDDKASSDATAGSNRALIFKATTVSGVAWLSRDGKHWHASPSH